jgi:folate-binding protein YgfZ
MQPLALHEFHLTLGARFTGLNGAEAVADYGDALTEHRALLEIAGVLDLSFRGRICLTGNDRVRFLHGQVTNDVKQLRSGEGCYAALVTAKGKMQSDLNIFCLENELLLDFEPGLTAVVSERLEKYIVADDVQAVDVASLYGLLSVQGPKAESVVGSLGHFSQLPARRYGWVKASDPTLGEIYVMNHSRLKLGGFDLFVPGNSLGAVADKLIAAARSIGGSSVGWQAFEIARIEAGIPRYGIDMDENSIPLECGIEAEAVSYSKGCYIGQEVINRIHSIGHVNRSLHALQFAGDLSTLPSRGDKLFSAGKEVGQVTSAVKSSRLSASVGIGYVRREVNVREDGLRLIVAGQESPVKASPILRE